MKNDDKAFQGSGPFNEGLRRLLDEAVDHLQQAT
jgi:hypothetical protein